MVFRFCRSGWILSSMRQARRPRQTLTWISGSRAAEPLVGSSRAQLAGQVCAAWAMVAVASVGIMGVVAHEWGFMWSVCSRVGFARACIRLHLIQRLTPHPPTPFEPSRSFVSAKMSSKRDPLVWPRSFRRHSECYLRRITACIARRCVVCKGSRRP